MLAQYKSNYEEHASSFHKSFEDVTLFFNQLPLKFNL